MWLQIRSSRRVPFAVICRVKLAGQSPKHGIVEVCHSEDAAAVAHRKLIDHALELGWKPGKRPAQLMEIPRPLSATGRLPGSGKRRKVKRGVR